MLLVHTLIGVAQSQDIRPADFRRGAALEFIKLLEDAPAGVRGLVLDVGANDGTLVPLLGQAAPPLSKGQQDTRHAHFRAAARLQRALESHRPRASRDLHACGRVEDRRASELPLFLSKARRVLRCCQRVPGSRVALSL